MNARRGDPKSSHRYVNRIGEDLSTYEKILRWAALAHDMGKPFTDTWLARKIGWPPRGTIARIRLNVEQDGWLERCGTTQDGLLKFRMKDNMRSLLKLVDTNDDFIYPDEKKEKA